MNEKKRHSAHVGTMGVLNGVMQVFQGMTHIKDIRFHTSGNTPGAKKEVRPQEELCDEIASQLDAAYQRGYADAQAEKSGVSE